MTSMLVRFGVILLGPSLTDEGDSFCALREDGQLLGVLASNSKQPREWGADTYSDTPLPIGGL